jgi:hypothetical protein
MGHADLLRPAPAPDRDGLRQLARRAAGAADAGSAERHVLDRRDPHLLRAGHAPALDKIIGKLYPVFGAVLLLMAAGILGGVIAGGYAVPELTLRDLHPAGLPVWPFLFVTVACGAISGFHATQSPMVAKCLRSEKLGRRVFYGAMLSESVIALVWAAGGVAFYGATGGLDRALADLGQSGRRL